MWICRDLASGGMIRGLFMECGSISRGCVGRGDKAKGEDEDLLKEKEEKERSSYAWRGRLTEGSSLVALLLEVQPRGWMLTFQDALFV